MNFDIFYTCELPIETAYVKMLLFYVYVWAHLCEPREVRELEDDIRPLELELEKVLSVHVGARNGICALWKRSKCS